MWGESFCQFCCLLSSGEKDQGTEFCSPFTRATWDPPPQRASPVCSKGSQVQGVGVYDGVLLSTAEYHSLQSLFPAPAPQPACGPVQSPFSLTSLGLWEVESSPAKEGGEGLGSISRKEVGRNARMENSTHREQPGWLLKQIPTQGLLGLGFSSSDKGVAK